MTVTRDVIYDLLPLYFAGQASEDTKTLVTDFFKADPEFGRMAERFASLIKDERQSSDRVPGEALALHRTRRVVRYRNQLIGLAIAFSLLPFAFGLGDSPAFFMLRDKPRAAVMFAVVAVAFWLGAYLTGRRSRHTGL
jgi:glycosyl transferase family 87